MIHPTVELPLTPADTWSDPDIRAFKTRVYLGALPLAIAASLLLWVVERAEGGSPFDVRGFLLLAAWLSLMFALTLLGVWRGRPERLMRAAEWLVLGGAIGFFLARDYFLLFPHHATFAATSQRLHEIPPWISVLYLLIFVALPRRAAVTVSVGFLLTSLGLGVGHVSAELGRGDALYAVSTTGHRALSGGATIALLYIFAILQERYAAAAAHGHTMTHLAMTDHLTGFPNRRRIMGVLERELALALRHSRPLALILFDIDGFKRVNDQFGHRVGDRVLSEMADLISSGLRATDWLGRLGGDEFVIVAPETLLEEASALAHRLRAGVEELTIPRAGRITATFGVAVAQDGDTPGSLISRADSAMYAGKARGCNTVHAAAATPSAAGG